MTRISHKNHRCLQPARRAALGLWLVMASAGLCSAGDGFVYPVFVSAPDTTVKVQTVIGSIDAVSVADSSKGQRSEIILEGQNGRQVLIVKATTTIYDAAWRPTGLDVLRKKDRVKVKYVTTGEGLSEALSIKQLP